jgi:hypothetical protein
MKFEKEIPKRHFCIITGNANPISTAAKELLGMLKSDGGHAIIVKDGRKNDKNKY